MSAPTVITFEEDVITVRRPSPSTNRAAPDGSGSPVAGSAPALTNRAAGQLRAAGAAAAPADVGLAGTGYERTAQDDAEAAAYRDVVARRSSPARPQPGPELAPTRTALTGTGPTAGASPGSAASADSGLAGTSYRRTAQDEADVATVVKPPTSASPAAGGTPTADVAAGADTDPLAAGRHTGAEPSNTAFAAAPIGSITTPAELVSASQAAAAALPQAELTPARLDALTAVVSGERARTGAPRRQRYGGGGRIPPPRPVDPIEIDPVPKDTAKLLEALNARLPDLELPAPRAMPDGKVPTVARPKGIENQDLPVEIPVDDTAAVVAPKQAAEKGRRERVIEAAKKPEPPQEIPTVLIDPPVLVDFRRDPEPVPSAAQDLADKANVAQALARILADTPGEAKKVVWAARDAAFPPDKLGDRFTDVTANLQTQVETDLATEMDKLRDAVGLSTDELKTAVATRCTDLERIKNGQQAQTEAVATAASRELGDEAKKRLAKEQADAQRAQRELVRRLQAAMHGTDPKLVGELVDKRMSVIDTDVAAGVVAMNAACDRRLTLLQAYESAYEAAYRKADSDRQNAMTGEKWAVNENGKVWFDVALDELRLQMKARRESSTGARDTLVKTVQDAGNNTRAAVRAWADKRLKVKAADDEVARRAAVDAAHQQEKVDRATADAAKSGTRNHLLNQVRLVAAVYDQDAKSAAGQVIDDAHKLDDEAVRIGRQLMAGNDKDPLSAVAAGLRQGFTKDKVAILAPEIQDKILRIDPTADNAADLAAVIFPGGTAGMDMRVDKLWTAFEGAGTTNSAVYEALTGLEWKQNRLLGVRYEARHDESLSGRIDSEMSGDEYDRAIGLYLDDKVKTAKAVISQSEGWFSDDKQMALDAISALPPDEAAKVSADPEVKARLGRVLGDWRVSNNGRYVPDNRARTQLELTLELKRITPQVAAGRPGQPPPFVELTPTQRDVQSTLNAVELDRAIRGHGEPDLDAMQKVYDRIRDTLKSDPRTAEWPAQEFENELRRRTRAMENAYEAQFAGELPRGGVSALRTAMAQRFVGGEKLDIARAQLAVDPAGEIAGHLQLATRGLWASDSDINKAMALNHDRARAEVQRSAEAQRDVEQKYQKLLKDHVAAGHKPSPEEQAAYRREATDLVTTDLAQRTFPEVTRRFGAKYADAWGGNPENALHEMLVDTTQFNGEDEALDRFKNGGGLTDAQQVHYGVTGFGMDRDPVIDGIGGRTKEQLARIGADYQRDYHENMVTRLKDESGGWDDSRDNGPMERNAFDVREALRGVPTTSDEALAAARRRFEYERDTYFRGNPGEREYAVGGQLWTMREALDRAERAHRRLETARAGGDPDLVQHSEAAFRNEQQGALATADAYRKAVDDYVEGQVKIVAIVAAVVAGVVVEVVSGGTATPAVVALVSSLAGTAASMATKADILGAAYGKTQIQTDLVVGTVDAIVSVLTARLGDILLGLPKATGATAAEIKASLKAIAAQRATKSLAARAGASAVQNFVQGAPTAMTAALLDRGTWRGDGARAVLLAGVTAGAVNVGVAGVIHGATNVAGRTARGLQALLSKTGGAEIAAETVVLGSTRRAVSEARAGGGDRLGHLGSPAERLAAQREYLTRFPDKTSADFRTALENGTASVESNAERLRELRRDMTRELLSGIPSAQRGQHVDTPIIVLSDADFVARTGSRSKGQAATLVVRGEPVVVMREGAPLSALREEGKHVRQILDKANAAKVALLEEQRLATWGTASVDEKIAGWHAKLDLETEAQRELIAELESELARAGHETETRAAMLERLDDARSALHTFAERRAQLDSIDDHALGRMREGSQVPPGFLADEPRLFNKSRGEPPAKKVHLEDTEDPLVKLGPIERDPDTGAMRRARFTMNPDNTLRDVVFFHQEGDRWITNVRPARVGASRTKYRWVDILLPGGGVLSTEQRQLGRGRWGRAGSAGRWAGGVAELAAKMENARDIASTTKGPKRVQFDAQNGSGHGFDDVVFTFGKNANGDVHATVGVTEIKDYPTDPVSKFSAVDANMRQNLGNLRSNLKQLVTEGRWADAGMSEAEARAALAAVEARRLDVEIRTTSETRVPDNVLPDLQRRLRRRFGTQISVNRGVDIPPASIEAAEAYFAAIERYRLDRPKPAKPAPRGSGGSPARRAPTPDMQQFAAVARRSEGYTVESIATAEAVVLASRNPHAGLRGRVGWAPGGAHLVDDAGPLLVHTPVRTAQAGFDPRAAAREILDRAATPLPGRTPPPTRPRVIVDKGLLTSGESQALDSALLAEARRRHDLPALTRVIGVADAAVRTTTKGTSR